MDVLQTLVHNASGRGSKQFHFIAVIAENFHDKSEMYRQHIRDKNCVGLFHFRGKYCAQVLYAPFS